MNKTFTEYEYVIVSLKRFNIKYKLPYWQKTYTELDNQSKSNIFKLRKSKVSVKCKDGIYYRSTKEKRISLKSRNQIVNRIFNHKINGTDTLEEYLQYKFDNDSVQKTDNIKDTEVINFLTTLGSFWTISKKEDQILCAKEIAKTKKYEVASFNDQYEGEGKSRLEIKKITPEKLEKFENSNKKMIKRWKNSKTYKLNRILNKYNKYISKWIYVDNTNKFEFLGKIYAVPKQNRNYSIGKDNYSKMDMILCIEDSITKKVKFFDMNINEMSDIKLEL